MFLTPNMIVYGARISLVVAGVIALLGLRAMGPGAYPPVWAAIAAGGALVPLLAIAFPWHRRADLLKGLLLFSGAVAATGMMGEPHALANASALAGGALMAFVALHAEGLRRDAREYGDICLDIIATERRREARARRRRHSGATASKAGNDGAGALS